MIKSIKLLVVASIAGIAISALSVNSCPNPFPTCKVWGGYTGPTACCLEDSAHGGCHDVTAELWTCAAGGSNRYKNIVIGTLQVGKSCDSEGCN
jgi:hypothetical protein